MGDTNGRGGLVDMLATGTAASVGVDAQILLINIHIQIALDIRHNIQRYKGSLTFSLSIERGNTHQTVYSLLGFQVAVGIQAVDLKSH